MRLNLLLAVNLFLLSKNELHALKDDGSNIEYLKEPVASDESGLVSLIVPALETTEEIGNLRRSQENTDKLNNHTPGDISPGRNDIQETDRLDRDSQRSLSNISAAMKQMLDLINDERRRNGADKLCFNDKLILSAQRHTNDMIQKDYFSHTGADGSSVPTRLNRVGYQWYNIGENIAINSSVDRAHIALMNSSGHRRNILNPALKQIGIGIGTQTRGTYRGSLYFTQIFGASKSERCSSSVSGPVTSCRDAPSNWYDRGGVKYNCKWYAFDSTRHCAMYGNRYRNFGKTANEACCACGGGDN